MRLFRDLERVGRRFPRPYLTLGFFDGVHRGHQEILRRLEVAARANGGTSIALTFHPHPAAILNPARAPLLLTPIRARLQLLAATGVDAIVAQYFSARFARLSAEEFVERLLVRAVGIEGVVVGHRVSFGYRRGGNAEVLRDLGRRYGFSVEVVGPVEVDGTLVSSSAARDRIAQADLVGARQLLGRWPAVYGRVRHGAQRGKQLGYPTANLPVAGMAVPTDGVYATYIRIRDEWLPSVSNLGTNPTFGENRRALEVHLLDRQVDLYGERVEVRLLERLRGEVKFESPQALVEQIGRDVVRAREVLATTAAE